MTKQLPALVEFTDEDINTIRLAIMPENAKEADLKLFLAQATRTGLDPLSKQIYCTLKQGKLQIGTTVDGFRVIAERSGKYAGQLGPFWCGKDGQWQDVWLDDKNPPTAAKVGIVRHDWSQPIWGVARYEAYKQAFFDRQTNQWKLNPTWAKMADIMLAKCAECLALRKAFPNDLSGLYGKEEIESISDGASDTAQGTITITTVEAVDATPEVEANQAKQVTSGHTGRRRGRPPLGVPVEGREAGSGSADRATYAAEVQSHAEAEGAAGDNSAGSVDDTEVHAGDTTVTLEDINAFLDHGVRAGFDEEALEGFIAAEAPGITQETLLTMTKAQLARATARIKGDGKKLVAVK